MEKTRCLIDEGKAESIRITNSSGDQTNYDELRHLDFFIFLIGLQEI